MVYPVLLLHPVVYPPYQHPVVYLPYQHPVVYPVIPHYPGIPGHTTPPGYTPPYTPWVYTSLPQQGLYVTAAAWGAPWGSEEALGSDKEKPMGKRGLEASWSSFLSLLVWYDAQSCSASPGRKEERSDRRRYSSPLYTLRERDDAQSGVPFPFPVNIPVSKKDTGGERWSCPHRGFTWGLSRF